MKKIEGGQRMDIESAEILGPRHPFIAFIGMTAVGKSEQAKRFAQKHGCALLDENEAANRNPYLTASYDALGTGDQELQLGSQRCFHYFKVRNYLRAEQISAVQPVVIEPAIEMDRIYAETRLSGDYLNFYLDRYEFWYDRLPKPDVIVYLRADLPVVIERMEQRAMESSGKEREVKLREIKTDLGYWTALNERLEDWAQREKDNLPIVVVDTSGSSLHNTPVEIMIHLWRFFDKNGNGLIIPEDLR